MLYHVSSFKMIGTIHNIS